MKSKIAMLCGTLLVASTFTVSAAEWVVGEPTGTKGDMAKSIAVGLVGDGVVSDAMIDLTYDAAAFNAKVESVGGASCTIHPKGGIVRVISPDRANQPIAKGMNVYCNIKLAQRDGAKAAAVSLTVSRVDCNKSDASAVDCGSEAAAL